MKPEQWRRIENLYNQAMELEESQQRPFYGKSARTMTVCGKNWKHY